MKLFEDCEGLFPFFLAVRSEPGFQIDGREWGGHVQHTHDYCFGWENTISSRIAVD